MKRIAAFLLFAGMSLTQACNNSTSNKDSVDSAKDMNSDKDTSSMSNNNDSMSTASSMPVDKDVSDFAVEAAAGGMMEVQLGQIAQSKAMNPRVKDFGSMMVQDHSAANDELKRMAQAKNITLPASISKDQQDDIDDLNKKTGKDFDKAYMSMMLDDHKKDIKKFEKAGSDLKDPDIKSFAMKTLPTLQKHLDSAKAISGKK
jgi:putative membrane protein